MTAQSGRLPINIWGDILLDGRPPVIRRVLTGRDAHECMYAWVYLNEFVTLSEMLSCATERPADATVEQRFRALLTAADDAQCQIGPDLLATFLPLAVYLDDVPGSKEFVELGSTLFSSILKLRIARRCLGLPTELHPLAISGIETSPFLRRASRLLHGLESAGFQLWDDVAAWRPSRAMPVLRSRYVASYAQPSTAALADFLGAFAAFHMEEPICLDGPEFETHNHGLRQTFFCLPALVAALEQAGWTLFVTELTPEFYDDRRCAVVRTFGVKRDPQRFLEAWQAVAAPVTLRPLSSETVAPHLREVATALTDTQWAALARFKQHFPIWGPAPADLMTPEDADALVARPPQNLDLRFEGGAIHIAIRQALG